MQLSEKSTWTWSWKNYSLFRIYGIIRLLYCILNLCYNFSLNVYFQEEYWKIEVNVKSDHVKNCGRNWGHLFWRKEDDDRRGYWKGCHWKGNGAGPVWARVRTVTAAQMFCSPEERLPYMAVCKGSDFSALKCFLKSGKSFEGDLPRGFRDLRWDLAQWSLKANPFLRFSCWLLYSA